MKLLLLEMVQLTLVFSGTVSFTRTVDLLLAGMVTSTGAGVPTAQFTDPGPVHRPRPERPG